MCELVCQKGLDCNPSSFFQLCDFGQVISPLRALSPHCDLLGLLLVFMERMLGQSLHESLRHVRVQSLLYFQWDYLNLTCECTPLPRPIWIFDPRSYSLCMHSHHGFWLSASCAHPTSLTNPWPRFIGSGLPAPVSLLQLSLSISGHSIPTPSHLLTLAHNGVSCDVSVQSLVER